MKKLGAEAVQAVALGHNRQNLKEFKNALLKIVKKQNDLKMEALTIYNKAEDAGFDRKALKFIVKEESKPMDMALKREINDMREHLKQLPLFILAPDDGIEVEGEEEEEEEEVSAEEEAA